MSPASPGNSQSAGESGAPESGRRRADAPVRHSIDEILEAQALLAAEVGVFCEPASAASVAGLLAAAGRGEVPAGAQVVCTVTGNGLKDTETALGHSGLELTDVPGTLEAAAEALGLRP